jgi:ABC-type Fe3+-hydroxamate transport system substrate-binding protein
MKRPVWFATLVLAVIFLLCFSGSESMAAEKVFKMAGEIAAIDLDHNTVIVEVPVGERLFTVGGPLSPEAVLKRGGQSVGLADFRTGDRVTVTWEATERGHLILSLKAR